MKTAATLLKYHILPSSVMQTKRLPNKQYNQFCNFELYLLTASETFSLTLNYLKTSSWYAANKLTSLNKSLVKLIKQLLGKIQLYSST